MTVEKTLEVAQLMDGLFEEAFLEKRGIIGQTVKLVIQAVRTDNGTLAV
jgi:hypothetical protein